MYEAPTKLAEELVRLDIETLDEAGQAALRELNTAGFEVEMGLRHIDLPEVKEIASQIGVQEFCPNDLTKRFGDEQMAGNWQQKGRLFFQLRQKIGDAALGGYAWTGPETCEELSDCENTFAIRLNEEFAGRGLGKLFATVVVSGSMALGMRNIGLETWKSNVGAWKSYLRAGAVFDQNVSRPDKRMTIVSSGRRLRRRQIDDTRMFMRYAQSFS